MLNLEKLLENLQTLNTFPLSKFRYCYLFIENTPCTLFFRFCASEQINNADCSSKIITIPWISSSLVKIWYVYMLTDRTNKRFWSRLRGVNLFCITSIENSWKINYISLLICFIFNQFRFLTPWIHVFNVLVIAMIQSHLHFTAAKENGYFSNREQLKSPSKGF